MILRDLPERERELFLGQYAEAIDRARQPAGFAELRRFLHDWSIRVIAVNSPGYYEAIAAVRQGEPGIPAQDVFRTGTSESRRPGPHGVYAEGGADPQVAARDGDRLIPAWVV